MSGLTESDLGELEELESGYCYACETNPVRLERALELAEELPTRWREIARNFPEESVTRKLLRACAKELAAALKATSPTQAEKETP
ncbi:MAG: hypothetical protein A2V88_15305 [Elusimicrobia bacterium RBG_16_66_12]|nr:MAG: hypothetical protein A2V88_15305 [Elusimicrobia bacterium RBG_16_66_12]